MSGFEFSPFGIVALGTRPPQMADGAMAGATADVEAVEPVEPQHFAARAPAAQHPAAARADTSRLKPVDVVKLARARLREVNREISRLKKLEVERDELRRLLDAATRKPAASLRSLPTRSA